MSSRSNEIYKNEYYMDQIDKDYNDYMDMLNTLAVENEIPDESKTSEKIISFLLSDKFGQHIITFVFLITVLRIIYDFIVFIIGVRYVNINYSPSNLLYYMMAVVVPFINWVISTRHKYKKYGYINIKMAGIIIAVISLSVVILNIGYICSCTVLIPLFLKIPISADINAGMIVNLARFVCAAFPLAVSIYVGKSTIDLLIRPETIHIIKDFKIDRNIDTRKNKESQYDYSVCVVQNTSRVFNVPQAVRKYHTLVMGPTGTGKTSMAFTPAIANDLDKRTRNENKQKKMVEKMLISGEAVLSRNITDEEFDKKYIKPVTKKARKKLIKIFEENPLCGATIVAPNETFGDEVYELCKARNLKNIYRVDPVLTFEGVHKEGFIGFNPLYINEDLSEFDKRLEIISKSRMFADVLQMIYEAGGTTDVYFSGLNKQITSTVCAVIIKAYPMLHEKYPHRYKRRQACPQDFLDVVTDFDLAKDYVCILEDYLRNPNHANERYDYENKIKIIKRDLLGEGAKTMREQIRGLVNIMSDILANPLVRDVLCADETIVLDKALAENQIIIINYELSLGDSDSRAFGEFFLLSFQNAVFRRPKSNRPLHLLFIDELPVLLHSSMEKIFSLYRQFNVCAAVAIQSLSQFDRQASTKFMKNVVLNNARTHIVFGGLGPEEMEYYQKIGGKDLVAQVQSTVSESALSLENTSLNYSERTSIGKEDVFDGRELRNKDFQQATLITIDDKNNVMDAMAVSLNFLTDAQKEGVKPIAIDWTRFYNTDINIETINHNRDDLRKSNSIRQQINTSMGAMVSINNAGFKLTNESDLSYNCDFNIKKSVGAIVNQQELSINEKVDIIREDIMKQRYKDAEIKLDSRVEVKTDPNIKEDFKEYMLGGITIDLTSDDFVNTQDIRNQNDDNKNDISEDNKINLDFELDALVDKIMG